MVLGFLSFMVISAVAFAIYMRTERVPSSALRRNTATRHLVKAAMAHAMSRVDDAIRNDPFPGLANTNGNIFANFYHDKDNNSMDLWLGRVFMPPDPAGLLDDNGSPVAGANEPGDANKFPWRFAPVTETVSVLNLEALGYLPPPLVNDVRFLSRSSWAAKWQNFPFDAGRFAFCAVNVSDYFDINRTKVGVRSSPLDSCVSLRGTLAYRSDGNEENVSESTFTSLAKMLGPEAVRQNYTNPDNDAGQAAGSDTEYVSLLDYNLAFGANPGGISILGPLFYDWIYNNRGSRKYFYGGTIKTAEGAMQARRQPFVTDSFATNETYEIDFAKLDGQPYSDINMNGQVTAQQVAMATSSKCVQRMYNKGILGEADVFTFYDYLDHDDIPLSLAMPSVECVPMVTAVELGGNFVNLKVVPPASSQTLYNPNVPGPTTETKTSIYTLDQSSFNSAGAGVRVLVAFPFRHFSGRNITGFKVQVAMKVFVASGTVPVRLSGDLAALKPNGNAYWNQQSGQFVVGQNNDVLAWSLYSNKVDVNIPKECDDQESAIMQINVMSWNGSATVPQNQPFFTEIVTTPGTLSQTMSFSQDGQASKSVQFDLRPYDNGTLVQQGQIQAPAGSPPALLTNPFKTYAMLWVRITDSSGSETYDLAPAVIDDDMLNNKNNNNQIFTAIMGSPSPGCLLFSDSATTYTYNNLAALSGSNPAWLPKALATVDPRYNYQPEDWFEWNQSNISGADWLKEIAKAGFFDVGNDRDPDIFMFTSNQGYLQSLGEFAFLPRLSDLKFPLGSSASSLLKTVSSAPGSATAAHATQPGDILNRDCAWRTYTVNRQFYDECARPGIGIGRNSNGIQTVNPYSDDEAVLMAAFAETPCDYWTTGRIVAGAESRKETLSEDFQKIVTTMGDKNQTSGDAIKEGKDCLKSAFCEKNDDSSSRMKAEEAKAIMRSFAEAFRAGGTRPWEDVYDEQFDQEFEKLNGGNDYTKTDGNAENFMGVNLNNCPLYSIDRKFLYSYWRDCFANKQQLFLIFVRAESTALGGPGEGTPSQQGGRAVALVWREPVAYDVDNHSDTRSDNQLNPTMMQEESVRRRRPHRMRVLFYHQFD